MVTNPKLMVRNPKFTVGNNRPGHICAASEISPPGVFQSNLSAGLRSCLSVRCGLHLALILKDQAQLLLHRTAHSPAHLDVVINRRRARAVSGMSPVQSVRYVPGPYPAASRPTPHASGTHPPCLSTHPLPLPLPFPAFLLRQSLSPEVPKSLLLPTPPYIPDPTPHACL